MCGRIAQFDKEKLAERYGVEPGPSFDVTPHWNVAPGQYAPVITPQGLETMKLGLIPWYVKDSEAGKARKHINATAEGLAERATFKRALREHRCIVPASGFYEWAKLGGRTGGPYYFHPTGDDVFSLAGLYESAVAPRARTTRPSASSRPRPMSS